MKDNNFYFIQTENSKRDVWHLGKYQEEKKAVIGEIFMFHESYITKYIEIQVNALTISRGVIDGEKVIETNSEIEFIEIENPKYEKDSN